MLEFVDPPKPTDEPVRNAPSVRIKEANPLYAPLKQSYDRRTLNREVPSDWVGETQVTTILQEDVEQFNSLIKKAAKDLEIGYETSREVVEGCALRIKFCARPARKVNRKKKDGPTPAAMPPRRPR